MDYGWWKLRKDRKGICINKSDTGVFVSVKMIQENLNRGKE